MFFKELIGDMSDQAGKKAYQEELKNRKKKESNMAYIVRIGKRQ